MPEGKKKFNPKTPITVGLVSGSTVDRVFGADSITKESKFDSFC
jgi:hypothetical protein